MIAIGGWAGAIDPLLTIAAGIARGFGGTILIVLHIGPNETQLPGLLARAGPLPVKQAEDGETIEHGTIYVAPPDQHVLVERDHIRLWHGPRQHFTRPPIDPLFSSIARYYGPRAIGVVLSGTGSDGSAGLEEIAKAGGKTVIQQPNDALYPEMPRNAAAAMEVDYVVPAAELPPLLQRLAAERVKIEIARAQHASKAMEKLEQPVALTCPECGGALRESGSAAVKQYRCHIGHRFGPEEVLAGQINEFERVLEIAIRVLNERNELCRRMADDAAAGGRSFAVKHWRQLQNEAAEQLAVLQRFLAQHPSPVQGEPAK